MNTHIYTLCMHTHTVHTHIHTRTHVHTYTNTHTVLLCYVKALVSDQHICARRWLGEINYQSTVVCLYRSWDLPNRLCSVTVRVTSHSQAVVIVLLSQNNLSCLQFGKKWYTHIVQSNGTVVNCHFSHAHSRGWPIVMCKCVFLWLLCVDVLEIQNFLGGLNKFCLRRLVWLGERGFYNLYKVWLFVLSIAQLWNSITMALGRFSHQENSRLCHRAYYAKWFEGSEWKVLVELWYGFLNAGISGNKWLVLIGFNRISNFLHSLVCVFN